MVDINIRYIEFYNFLITQKIVSSGKEFAANIGVSGSLITEITKGRSVVGSKAIQNTVLFYNLNADWQFTGSGEMNKVENPDINTFDSVYFIKRFEEIISENTLLKQEVDLLRKSAIQSGDPPGYYITKKRDPLLTAEP